MIRIMIVDDDKNVRNRLRSNIPWEKLNAVCCAESADGDEALCLYEEQQPDISIIDIRMPNLDGLEVTSAIMDQNGDAVVIIITSYNDFTYAQRALKLGAFDILAKPLDFAEVTASLEKAIAMIDERLEKRRDTERFRQLMIENLPLLQKNFIKGLLRGMDAAQATERLAHLDIDILGQRYVTAILMPLLTSVSPTQLDVMLVALQNVADDHLRAASLKSYSLYDSANHLIVLASYDEDDSGDLIDTVFSQIRNKCLQVLQIDVYAAVGSEVDHLGGLKQSLLDAREALNYRTVFAQNNVVNIKNVIRLFNRPTSCYSRDIEEVLTLVKTGEGERLAEELARLTVDVLASSMGNLNPLKRTFIELTVLALHVAYDVGVDEASILEQPEPYRYIQQLGSVNEITSWFLALCDRLAAQIAQKKENRTSRIVDSAKEFIEQNLADPNLGVPMISAHVGLSKAYFGQMFHSQVGCGATQYIQNLRVEQAKRLLRTSEQRISAVAVSVGFLDPKYFNYVFKRITGFTPNQYRTMTDGAGA